MFHASILQIQEELHYHQQQQEKLEQELYVLKSYEEFAGEAFDNVRDTIEQIEDPKCLELFKESLLSLFRDTPIYLEEKAGEYLDEIEYIDDSHPGYKSIKQLQEEDPDTVVTVFRSEEQLKKQNIKHSSAKNEESKKSYCELTGRPDVRPTTYEDMTFNITYSSSSRAYIGFNDYKEAEKFRESLDVSSMLDKAQIMNNHKWEVKFYCDRHYLEELREELENDWTPEQKAELDFQERLIRIAPDIFYDGTESTCYLGFRAKGRADNYGSYLTRILDIAETYVVNKEPIITTNTKYELRLNAIAEEDAQHLANFNLKRDYDHPDHREVREVWRTTRQRQVPPACKPLPRSTPIEKIELGEIVSVGSNSKQYKVLDKVEFDGVPHLEVVATYNSEMPALVGKTSYLKEVYRVLPDDVRIDPMFEKEKELDFPAPPYNPIPLSEVELCDVVTTSPNSKSGYEVREHKGSYIVAVCLYNVPLPKRVGEEFTFSNNVYLVEKGDISLAA